MFKKTMVALVSTALLYSIGCGGPSILVNPAAKFPVAVADNAPAFLFPVNLSHAGVSGAGDTKAGLSVSAGIAAKFGKKVVSGQQLFDQVGNLSYELAEAISSQAKAGSWKMDGAAAGVASALATKMSEILSKLVSLNLIPAGYKFKYIIAVHSHGEAGTMPKTVKVNSWGGIYDVETQQILDYIESSDTLVDDANTALAQLPMTYNGIIQHLLDGK